MARVFSRLLPERALEDFWQKCARICDELECFGCLLSRHGSEEQTVAHGKNFQHAEAKAESELR